MEAIDMHVKPELLEYRVQRLEEAVLKLSALAEVVTRWDERFMQQGGMLQCNIHTMRMQDIERKLGEMTEIVVERTKAVLLVNEHEIKLKTLEEGFDKLKAYLNKAVGALVVVSIVVQLLGPLIIGMIKSHI